MLITSEHFRVAMCVSVHDRRHVSEHAVSGSAVGHTRLERTSRLAGKLGRRDRCAEPLSTSLYLQLQSLLSFSPIHTPDSLFITLF